MELKNGDVGSELSVSTTTKEGGELKCSLLICSVEMYRHLEPQNCRSHMNVRAPRSRWLSVPVNLI